MFNAKTQNQYSFWTVFLLSGLLLNPSIANAIEKANISIPRVSGNIDIDAKLDEPQWQQATKVLINNITRPHNNIESPVQTQALLMEDGNIFYIAFIAQDPDPTQIRAFLRDRDKAWGDDIVGVKLDTYNDQRTAYRFLVNPLGSQIDGIENEVTNRESDSWDGIWDSAGAINEDGYIVEMALPLRMLTFKEKNNIQHWGIELLRMYPRDERLRLSNIHMDRGNNCELCQLHTVSGFKAVKQGNNLTVAPSIVMGSNEERDTATDEWNKNNNTEASLDFRWGITPDLLLNATVNPDFSTVETDSARLNINNNFALHFEEKRPFFLDNADYFESDYNLVYTRNINAPNYGAKLTGRKNDHAFGLFITDDDSTNILIPGNRSSSIAEIAGKSQATALRYRYNYNSSITLGWISTLRTADKYENAVHGIDARIRLSQFDVFRLQSLYSMTEYPDDLFEQFCNSDKVQDCKAPDETSCEFDNCDYNESLMRTRESTPFNGNALRAGYFHNDSQWYYRTFYHRQNSGFRGDLGFISNVDYNIFSVGGERKWYAEPGAWWSKASIYSDWDITHNDNNELIEKEFDINSRLEALYGTQIRLGYSYRDLVGSRIDKSSLKIEGNTTLFTEKQIHLNVSFKPILGLNLNTNINYGDAIDYSNNRLGLNKQINFSSTWNLNQHLEVKAKQIFRQLNADNENVFIARLTDLRTTYQFDIKSFLRFTLVYNNTSRNPSNYLYVEPNDIDKHSKSVSLELLYAYKINPQTVFYLGYSDNHQAEEKFNNLEQNQRSMFMKFSYAWLK